MLIGLSVCDPFMVVECASGCCRRGRGFTDYGPGGGSDWSRIRLRAKQRMVTRGFEKEQCGDGRQNQNWSDNSYAAERRQSETDPESRAKIGDSVPGAAESSSKVRNSKVGSSENGCAKIGGSTIECRSEPRPLLAVVIHQLLQKRQVRLADPRCGYVFRTEALLEFGSSRFGHPRFDLHCDAGFQDRDNGGRLNDRFCEDFLGNRPTAGRFTRAFHTDHFRKRMGHRLYSRR